VRRWQIGRQRYDENPGCTRGPHGGVAIAGAHTAIGRQGADSRRVAAVVERSPRCPLNLASVFAHAADTYGGERQDEQRLEDGETAKDGRVASHCREPALMGPRVDAAGQPVARVWMSAPLPPTLSPPPRFGVLGA
jgi:hypothetical protein